MLAYATFWFSLKCFFVFFGGAVVFKTLKKYAHDKEFNTGDSALGLKFFAIVVGLVTLGTFAAFVVSFVLALVSALIQLYKSMM